MLIDNYEFMRIIISQTPMNPILKKIDDLNAFKKEPKQNDKLRQIVELHTYGIIQINSF